MDKTIIRIVYEYIKNNLRIRLGIDIHLPSLSNENPFLLVSLHIQSCLIPRTHNSYLEILTFFLEETVDRHIPSLK